MKILKNILIIPIQLPIEIIDIAIMVVIIILVGLQYPFKILDNSLNKLRTGDTHVDDRGVTDSSAESPIND